MENGEKIIKENRKKIKEMNKEIEKLEIKITNKRKEVNKMKDMSIQSYEKLRDTIEK